MKVEVLRGFCLGGGNDANPGDVVEVPERDAARLFSQGKARPHRGAQENEHQDAGGAPDTTPGNIQNTDPQAANADPKHATQANQKPQPGRPAKAK